MFLEKRGHKNRNGRMRVLRGRRVPEKINNTENSVLKSMIVSLTGKNRNGLVFDLCSKVHFHFSLVALIFESICLFFSNAHVIDAFFFIRSPRFSNVHRNRIFGLHDGLLSLLKLFVQD